MLTKLLVELQSGTQGSCGSHFHEDTMLCAVDSEDNKDIVYEPEYCQVTRAKYALIVFEYACRSRILLEIRQN